MPSRHSTGDLRLEAFSDADIENAVITLDRGPSFSSCPGYRLSLRGDGTVVYEADDFVKGKRVERKKIPHATVRALIAEFVAAGYFFLRLRQEAKQVEIRRLLGNTGRQALQ